MIFITKNREIVKDLLDKEAPTTDGSVANGSAVGRSVNISWL